MTTGTRPTEVVKGGAQASRSGARRAPRLGAAWRPRRPRRASAASSARAARLSPRGARTRGGWEEAPLGVWWDLRSGV